MDTFVDLRRTKASVGFKKYILSLDVHSRAIVIERCIAEMQKSNHSMKTQCLGWLENLRNINELLDSKERREQIRFDAYWAELHNQLTLCPDFLSIVLWFS